ncbi:precorrin-3B C(17)-methyltransferase [Faunimonas sp. B44]|uniref:precorrin-3B C(17)-methyltransferase n=1 Tax=Faunimonas sp. B44 TaxID=3461493 RepID=UPI0040440E03
MIALTVPGLETARLAAKAVGGEVHARDPLEAEASFADIAPRVRALFEAGRPILGVCAAGILIRILAPLLGDKRAEPPVLAISEDGASIVPLLGGHRGANDLARQVAEALGGRAAITTAGDARFGIALDAPPPGWILANPADAKPVMAALLAGASARLEGEAPWLAASLIPFSAEGTVRLVASIQDAPGDEATLVYHPRRLAVGIGSERGADPAEVATLVRSTLAEAGLAPGAVACVASVDLKADEPAILAAAEALGAPVRFFGAARLEAETPRLANPSDVVFAEIGCHGVAEAAALAAAGPGAELVVPKRKSARATCAVAAAPEPFDPRAVGRARGRLAVVGTGPGEAGWLTPEARRLIEEADAIVGYRLYLELIEGLNPKAERFSSDLGAEEERVLVALRLAGEGLSVALVSSGDPGIYALATLVFECLERAGLPDGARRAEIVVAPGISAMQAAAARIGAPLGHDFCAISLSDLLTDWEAIEARVRAAAEADFVIAFYNPVSRRRRTQLAAAKAILLAHRPPDTPVVTARNLGREGETVEVTMLSALDPERVDMLTVVIVGASTSRRIAVGGAERVYTPRGYARKRSAE